MAGLCLTPLTAASTPVGDFSVQNARYSLTTGGDSIRVSFDVGFYQTTDALAYLPVKAHILVNNIVADVSDAYVLIDKAHVCPGPYPTCPPIADQYWCADLRIVDKTGRVRPAHGVCIPRVALGVCVCTFPPMRVENTVPRPSQGSVIEVVIDPINQVEEDDEGNNRIVAMEGPPVPAASGFGLALGLGLVGLLALWSTRRVRAAHPEIPA